jgi:hypothetical protein
VKLIWAKKPVQNSTVTNSSDIANSTTEADLEKKPDNTTTHNTTGEVDLVKKPVVQENKTQEIVKQPAPEKPKVTKPKLIKSNQTAEDPGLINALAKK